MRLSAVQSIGAAAVCTAALFPVRARAQHRKGAVLVARIIDVETGNPLEGTDLRVVELKREARSNAQGIVHLENIPEGSYDLFVRRLGYRPFVGSLEFHAGDSIEVAIVLQPLQLLDTVHVTGHVALTPQLRQFRIRERKGLGHFLDDSLLARKRDVSLITVLTTQLPGLARLWDIGESGNRLVSLRGIDSLGPPQPCFVTIYLDDTPVPDIDLAMVHPNELAGVEYYTDADIPAQYRTLGARCGVLLLWSKPPRR